LPEALDTVPQKTPKKLAEDLEPWANGFGPLPQDADAALVTKHITDFALICKEVSVWAKGG
jgi:hypothetical protein